MPGKIAVTLIAGALGIAQLTPAERAPHAELPVWRSSLTQPNRFVSAHGLRGFSGGYSEDGLEFWSFPLQLVSDYHLDFVLPDAAPVVGLTIMTSVEVDPLGVTRVYTAPSFRVRERITTHAEDPGVSVQYRVEGRDDLRLRVRFRPSLNLMWPAGIGGQETAWDAAAKGFLLSEPTHRFRALIASPEAGAHSEIDNDRRNSAFDREMHVTLEPRADVAHCGNDRCATLALAGQSESGEDVHRTLQALLAAAQGGYDTQDTARFALPDAIRVTTPDAEANRAIRWAQIALEQAWVCNARLGCGLVAGYGPSHGARRPQYAWFFAGDGLVATEALLREGDFRRAGEELELLFRYQKPDDGLMWHEISQSAGFLNWAKDYPYLYVHVDITFDFLAVLADYVRTTGDQALLAQHWEAIRRAYTYCASTLDGEDGLPRVPPDKLSLNEQDRLTDELTLSAAWVRAAHAMSELATRMHEPGLAGEAEKASLRAKQSTAARYWNPTTQQWTSGFTRAGAPMASTAAGSLAAAASGAATPTQAAQTMDQLAESAMRTPWGIRSKPSTASDYDPTAYAKGSVWGIETATAAEALWRSHRAVTAYELWASLVPWASADSLGHMHEVMSGRFFVPQRESVPEQTWSSAAFLSAAVGGLLGLSADGAAGSLSFAPQLPAAWSMVTVEHVRVGQSVLDLRWQRQPSGPVLRVRTTGARVHLRWVEAVDQRQGSAAAITVDREIMPGETELHLRP